MATKAIERRREAADWWTETFRRLWGETPMMWFGEGDTIRVEEFVDDDDLVVRAEMPGIDPDKDVAVSVHDHMLEITAERKEESKVDEKDVHRSEFRYGKFARRLTLPPEAKEGDVHATYKDGILEVRVPMAPTRPEATHVKVQRV